MSWSEWIYYWMGYCEEVEATIDEINRRLNEAAVLDREMGL